MDKYIYYDKEKLYRVLINLLGNSAKFTKEGSISLNIRIDNDKSVFEVIDTGIGIPEEQLRNIFEPFYQVDNSMTREYQGSGLGLALCKSMAELMNGIIEIESEQGNGTQVRLVLSPTETAYVLNDNKPVSDTSGSNIHYSSNSYKSKKILIVDDDYGSRETLMHMLDDQFTLALASNGRMAIDLFKNEKYDMVLLDIMMSEIDGYEVIEQLHAIDINVPVIAITALAMPEDKKKIFSHGFLALVTKPVNQDDLIDVIKKFIL